MTTRSLKGQSKLKDKRRLKMLPLQEAKLINNGLYLLQERMSHLGTLTCLMVIAFHVLTSDIWLGISECMTRMVVKYMIKTLEASLQDHKKEIQMTFPTESICCLHHHLAPPLNDTNSITMSIYLTVAGEKWNIPL